MMNTQKVLLILGGLFLGAALATYLMFLQADNRAAEEARKAGAEGDVQATQPAPFDSSISENHVTQGSIDPSQSGAQSGGTISKSMAATQQAVEAAPAPAIAPSPAPVSNAPGTLTQQQLQQQLQQAQRELKQLQLEQAQQQARLQAQLSVPVKGAPSTAVASVNAQDPSAVNGTQATQSQRPRRARDELQRRMMTGATPETMELVRESAKLDPSLPPPDMSAVQAAMDHAAATDNSPQPAQPNQQQARASKPGVGSNSIAASMTDQLVRDSAKLDPSLPPPK